MNILDLVQTPPTVGEAFLSNALTGLIVIIAAAIVVGACILVMLINKKKKSK